MWKISNRLSVLELLGFCCVFSSIFSLFQKGIIAICLGSVVKIVHLGGKLISSVNVFLPVTEE